MRRKETGINVQKDAEQFHIARKSSQQQKKTLCEIVCFIFKAPKNNGVFSRDMNIQ